MKIPTMLLSICLWLSVFPIGVTAQSNPTISGRGEGYTLKDVLSAPFPSDLIPAPVKGWLAWVFNAEGKRNIWIAEHSNHGNEYTSRQLTKYATDDGQELGELCWTPDGEALVYVRGGDLEFPDFPYPNPASVPQRVQQGIWIVSAGGGEPRRIAEGHSPAISPNGVDLAYIFKGQVWLGKTDSSAAPAELIFAKGESSSLRWSPDGNSLAFVSIRGDHSFIGVYALAPKTLRYLNPTMNYDAEPAWSPDSRSVAFLRIPTRSDDLNFEPKREGPPWSIQLADTDSNSTTQIWKAPEGRGSVYREIVAPNQLFWGAGDRIVFSWEGDGWTHLYSVPTSGGQPFLLTPGPFEVEYVSLSFDRRTVVYSSNQDDIDRRHVWKVAVDRNTPEQLSKGSGVETAPVVTSDNRTAAVLRADAQLPMRPAVVSDPSNLCDLAPETLPAEFPAKQLVVPQQVIISVDGLEIHGQLFLPAKSIDGGRHPAVVFFHGGSRRQMLLGWHYSDYYSNAYAMNQYLASRGYVVLALNYRRGIGYGLEFREVINYGATGAIELNDSKAAARYLGSRSDVDSKRIGVWGGSYGGFMTALSLARASNLYAAGVDLHGVHDFNVQIQFSVPFYNPFARPDAARLAWESSPLSSVKDWRSPVLLVMGDDDRQVPFSEMVTLAEALRKQGVDYEQLIIPDEIHGFLLHRSWVAVYSAVADFFDRHLRSSVDGSAPKH